MPSFLLTWWMLLYWTFSDQWPRPYDDWKNGLFYVGAGLCCCGILWRPRRQRLDSVLPRAPLFLIVCILVYSFAAGLSLTASNVPSYEGLLAAARLFLWGMLTWGIAHLSPEDWRTLAKWAVGSAAAIALLGWCSLHDWGLWRTSPNFIPPIGHVTYYGDFMALHLPLAVYLIGTSRYRASTLCWTAALFSVTLGVVLSATRASMVGAITAFVFLLILASTMRLASWRKIIAIGGVVFLMAVLIHTLQPLGHRQYSALNRLRELTSTPLAKLTTLSPNRWQSQVIASRMALQRPVTGWGIGAFRFIYPEFAHARGRDPEVTAMQWYMHPHNECIHQAIEVGGLGLLAFIGIWGTIYVAGLRRLRATIVPHEQEILLTALAGLTIAIVSWQFSTNFLHPLSRLLTAFYAGGLWRIAQGMVPATPSTLCSRRLNFGYFAAASTLVVGCTLFLLSHHLSLYAIHHAKVATTPAAHRLWIARAHRLAKGAFDSRYAHAAMTFAEGDLGRALPEIDRLLRAFPYVPNVLFLAAQSRLRTGHVSEAKIFLHHALANDPGLGAAKDLLNQLP